MKNLSLAFGDVTKKQIITPNDFVSHMIEHIAWRFGCRIDLVWDDHDWRALGVALGSAILALEAFEQPVTTCLGAIDDGLAKVRIDFSHDPELKMTGTKNVDLDFFLKTRCEQIANHQPLTELLDGLAASLGAKIEIVVLNFKDPHHTWEGIFRGVGICLQKACPSPSAEIDLVSINKIEEPAAFGDLKVLKRSLLCSKVCRGTAESGVTVEVNFSGEPEENTFILEVDKSIKKTITNLDQLLLLFAQAAGVRLNIQFRATILSSSHVVWEDIGLVLGRALLEILKLRFEKTGAMGAGSSLMTAQDFDTQNGSVMVSVEGRTSWDFIPSDGNKHQLLKTFLVGHQVLDHLRSEDLDDFIDGLAGGLSAAIMVHINEVHDPNQLWQEIFINLGTALREVFEINDKRKGIPPGVKATLS